MQPLLKPTIAFTSRIQTVALTLTKYSILFLSCLGTLTGGYYNE